MAKVVGALMSLWSQGLFSRSLVYRKNGNINTVGRMFSGCDRKSNTQINHRENFSIVVDEWSYLSVVDKAVYIEAGAELGMTGLNYYVKVTLPLYESSWCGEAICGIAYTRGVA